ncbi:DegV family protein [Chloroflexota bacterium]
MAVKIVTDSTSDISPEVAKALNIAVVPAYIRFGSEVYRDGVDISTEEFYYKLTNSQIRPITVEPSPDDFAKVYSECSKEADGVISIHLSAKISRTYDSALQGKKLTKGESPIEVIDSCFTSVGLLLIVLEAARLSQEGENWQSILENTDKDAAHIHMYGLFDTMKYLATSERLSGWLAVMANARQVKPILTFHNGEIVRAGLATSYADGIDKLYEFARLNSSIRDLAIAYSDSPEKADQLTARLGTIFPKEKIRVTKLGATLGVHSGPGALVLALRQKSVSYR